MKIVLITGGSRGIGASTARHCAARGMAVVLTYNASPSAAADVINSIEIAGGTAVALKLDTTDIASFPAFRDTLRTELRARWRREDFDALVNNAGYGLFKPIEAITEAEFDGLCDVHLKGPFFLTQTLLPLLADGGHILNVCSATTRVATAGVAPYAACKGGLEVLTRYMAKEFGPRGIRANAIAPGPIRTEIGGGMSPEFERLLASQIALGRVGEPDDVGDAVAGLLAEESRWINAQTIEIGGGYTI